MCELLLSRGADPNEENTSANSTGAVSWDTPAGVAHRYPPPPAHRHRSSARLKLGRPTWSSCCSPAARGAMPS